MDKEKNMIFNEPLMIIVCIVIFFLICISIVCLLHNLWFYGVISFLASIAIIISIVILVKSTTKYSKEKNVY